MKTITTTLLILLTASLALADNLLTLEAHDWMVDQGYYNKTQCEICGKTIYDYQIMTPYGDAMPVYSGNFSYPHDGGETSHYIEPHSVMVCGDCLGKYTKKINNAIDRCVEQIKEKNKGLRLQHDVERKAKELRDLEYQKAVLEETIKKMKQK